MDSVVSCIVLGCRSCGAHGLISIIKQLKNQTYADIEIIPITCCLNDREVDFVERFTGCKITRTEHNNTYDKDNLGIQMAKGKYLGFFAGDDLYERNYVGRMFHALEENDLDLAYCDFYSHYRQDGTASPGALEMGHITNGSFIVRAELAKKHTVPVTQTGDIEYVQKLMADGLKSIYIPEALYIHI